MSLALARAISGAGRGSGPAAPLVLFPRRVAYWVECGWAEGRPVREEAACASAAAAADADADATLLPRSSRE